jgi:RimJ/RimL family protein N-acetyltransferase
MQASDFNITLKNGTQCSIRLCHTDLSHDRELLKEGIRAAWGHLSPQSRFYRFGYAPDRLNDEQLDYLADLDNLNRLAWCAYTGDTTHSTGIGIARYMRLQNEPGVAEFAVTVVDEHQHAGLGSILLERLVESARAAGLETLRGYIRPNNRAMLALAKKFGAVAHKEDEYLQVDISLAPGKQNSPAHAAPQTPGESRGN